MKNSHLYVNTCKQRGVHLDREKFKSHYYRALLLLLLARNLVLQQYFLIEIASPLWKIHSRLYKRLHAASISPHINIKVRRLFRNFKMVELELSLHGITNVEEENFKPIIIIGK